MSATAGEVVAALGGAASLLGNGNDNQLTHQEVQACTVMCTIYRQCLLSHVREGHALG